MEAILDIKVNNNMYSIRTETYEGIPHIVVPVVMMVEGVHSGSHGPLLHTAAELGKYPQSWDGIPVVINHPMDNEDNNVSANSPQVIEQYSVGRVFNTHMEGDKLKAEAWIAVNQIEQKSPLALAHIRDNRPLDVSVGVFTDEVETNGIYNSVTYEAIATNHRPDHLALLPGGTGACSWNDGCGVRTNKKGGNMKKEETDNKNLVTFSKEKEKELAYLGLSVSLVTNEQGLMELADKIQRKLDSMDTDTRVHWLEELFTSDLIYRVRINNPGGVSQTVFFRTNYSIDSNGEVTFTGEPVQVRKDVNYVNVNELKRTKKKEVNTMEEKKPCCPEKVDALIANAKTNFTKEDKEQLLTFSAEMIEKLTPVEEKAAPIVNAAEVKTEKKEAPKTNEEYIATLPKEMQDQFRTGIALHEERKTKVIKNILDNSVEGVWTEESLKTFEFSMLEKISNAIPPKVDYSGMGTNTASTEEIQANKEDILLPAGVGEVETTKK